MANITSLIELKSAIQSLEVEQTNKRQLLKEQLHNTYESLRPINVLKRALKEIASSRDLSNNIVGTASGLASGYLSRKIFIGSSGNLIRKLIGSILQYGVTSIVSRNPAYVKSIGQTIFQSLFHKKKQIS